VRIPRPPKGARQSYAKFTLRRPLDFAVVSVAAIIALRDGVCTDARIVLGAVGPAPTRAGEAELAIKGKTIDAHNAAEAAELAFAEAQPLAMNKYKVEIARTLVKRSILGVS
jgi:xanthine dehydrogenase YagS FAD-binding subunit